MIAALQFARRLRREPESIILLVDELGRGVAFPLAALTWEGTISTPTRNPVVRFHPHTIDLPSGVSAAPIEALITYREGVKEALAGAGVTSLRRLFPERSPSSEFRTNLLGEPILADNLADIYIAILDSTAATASTVTSLRTQPWVQYADASPNTASLFTNDPYWPQQWNLNNTGASSWVQQICGYPAQAGIDVGAQAAWSLTQGSAQTRIAVIDNGVLSTHPDLPPHLVVGPFFTAYPPPGGSRDCGDRHHLRGCQQQRRSRWNRTRRHACVLEDRGVRACFP